MEETKNELPVECTQPVIFELQDPFPLFFQWNALYFHTETNTLALLRVSNPCRNINLQKNKTVCTIFIRL